MPIARSLQHPAGLLAFALAFRVASFRTFPPASHLAWFSWRDLLSPRPVDGFASARTPSASRCSASSPLQPSRRAATTRASRCHLKPLSPVAAPDSSAEYLAVLRMFVPQRLQVRSIWGGVMAWQPVAQSHLESPHRSRRTGTCMRASGSPPPISSSGRGTPSGSSSSLTNGYLHSDRWIPFASGLRRFLSRASQRASTSLPVSAQDPLPLKPHSLTPPWVSKTKSGR